MAAAVLEKLEMQAEFVVTSSASAQKSFPPEAYAFDDDVTPEGVDQMRKMAAKTVNDEEWQLVDGFGLST